MIVRNIIDTKAMRQIVTIKPSDPVKAAMELLAKHRIGAVIVSRDGEIVDGILSERDIVVALGDGGEALPARPVREIMTRTVITCDPHDSVGELMAEMTNRRIRHLPVIADGRLRGIVSIGDLVKNRLGEVEFEASARRSFIAGG